MQTKYVGIIERSICAIKERAGATCHTITFKRYTSLMKKSPIEGVVDLLNRFPSKDGVSDNLSTSTIVEGIPKVDMGQNKLAFGSYALVQIGTTNTMQIRCVPAISLKVSNDSGGYYFMNIFTGKLMHSYNRKELSTTEEIIEQVDKLSGYERRPIMGDV